MTSQGSITTTSDLAIVIAAHNRPASLQRLLTSVAAADIAPGTPLVVSIDTGGEHSAEVSEVASATTWSHGQLSVVEHETCGLVEHFRRCGDLTQTYGSVVFLEDDLLVGPGFYRWAAAALAASAADDRIAGSSLASPFFDGYRHLPFEPVLDGSDGVYAQVPWYDGMVWSAEQWERFRRHEVSDATPIHASFKTLDSDEWFPDAVRYLVETDRYYLLPRDAHATNTGAAGAHFEDATDYFQVPITLRAPDAWRVHSLDDSLAVYDDHMELHSSIVAGLVPALRDKELTMDLRGVRDLATVATSHVLTTRNVTVAERTWGASLHPLIANVVHGIEGDAIRLAATGAVIDSSASSSASLETLSHHAQRGRAPSTRATVERLARDVTNRIRRGR